MADMDDRRAYPRLREKDSVVVTVLSAPEVPELENKTFFCTSEDLSSGGLKLRLSTHVPVGAVLGLRVAFTLPLGTFRHIGRVAWSEEGTDSKACLVGVEFTYTLSGRAAAWKDIVEKKLTLQEKPPAEQEKQGQ